MKPNSSSSLVFTPAYGEAEQLFVLLHGEFASPEQLLPLARAIRAAFPRALIVLPYGLIRERPLVYQWFNQANLNDGNYGQRVAYALPALIALIQQIRARNELSGQQTALAGFSQGATMALEACTAQPGLAGRVLAFSGRYARIPDASPQATTLHLLHGADDRIVPVSHARNAHARLNELRGDATLDIASRVGHQLHSALISQAIHRLQTTVPLRSWEAALSHLQSTNETFGVPGVDMHTPGNKTLH